MAIATYCGTCLGIAISVLDLFFLYIIDLLIFVATSTDEY